MNAAIFIIVIILASGFSFAHFSEAEFTQTHEAELVQLSLAGAVALLVLFAIFSQSFLLFCLEFAGALIGLGTGRLAAGLYERYEDRLRRERSSRMQDSAY